MSDDTNPRARRANLGSSRLEQTKPVTQGFNQINALEGEIAKASPEAQRLCKKLQQLGQARYEKELKDQKRARAYRERKAQVGLLTHYIESQHERPDEIRRDPSQDLAIIKQQAQDMVRAREEAYLKNIARDLEANLRETLSADRQGPRRDGPDFEHEQER